MHVCLYALPVIVDLLYDAKLSRMHAVTQAEKAFAKASLAQGHGILMTGLC